MNKYIIQKLRSSKDEYDAEDNYWNGIIKALGSDCPSFCPDSETSDTDNLGRYQSDLLKIMKKSYPQLLSEMTEEREKMISEFRRDKWEKRHNKWRKETGYLRFKIDSSEKFVDMVLAIEKSKIKGTSQV